MLTGQVFGYDTSNPKQYRCVAYQLLPDGETFFGAYACPGGVKHDELKSASHGDKLPRRDDIEVSRRRLDMADQ